MLDIINAIRAAVEAIAIAVGGLWVAWTFHKLQSVRAANAEINNNVATARESDRRLLGEQPNLDITFLEIVEQSFPSAGNRSLIVSVELRNSGVRNLEIAFGDATLSVARLQSDGASTRRVLNVNRTSPYYLPERGDRLEALHSRVFRVGQRRTMLFLAPVAEPGPYLVQFQAKYVTLPFEGEQSAEVVPMPILAVEQRIFPVAGKSPSASTVLRRS